MSEDVLGCFSREMIKWICEDDLLIFVSDVVVEFFIF